MTKEKQYKIVNALITYPTRKEACKSVGISERTLYNYLQDPEFKNTYNSIIDGITKDTEAKIKEAALKAINNLVDIIENEDVDCVTKIKADRVILEHLSKTIECDNKYW